MRVLIVVPHFYQPAANKTRYASYSALMRDARRQVLDRLIFNLQRLFGTEHYGAKHHVMQMERLPNPFALELDIKICTTGGHHLIDELTCPARYYEHIASEAEPLLLGFFAHTVLKAHAGRYDYYGYMEDDILIHDPFFFKKLQFFNQSSPMEHLLQPQRYDSSLFEGRQVAPFLTKVYPDHQTREPYPEALSYQMETLGVPITLTQTTHPHAGCFFVTAEQFEHLCTSPDFGCTTHVNRQMALDDAATLAIARRFVVFKPAAHCMPFFEVEHGIINMLKQVSQDESGHIRWSWDPNDFDLYN